MTTAAAPLRRAQARIRQLYEGGSAEAHRFRYALLVFDLVTLLFIVATSFVPRNDVVEALDVVFGLVILADFGARLFISRHRLRDLLHPVAWADIAAIVSFLAPLVGEAAGFLRILRTLRLLRSYQLLMRLRRDIPYFRDNEEVIIAVANFVVFLFVMTGFVYETQHASNPAHRELCGRALFHRHRADHDRLRRHHAAGHHRPADLGRHHDLRRDAVLRAGARGAAPEQGALPLPDLRPAAPRARRGALQGLRRRC